MEKRRKQLLLKLLESSRKLSPEAAQHHPDYVSFSSEVAENIKKIREVLDILGPGLQELEQMVMK